MALFQFCYRVSTAVMLASSNALGVGFTLTNAIYAKTKNMPVSVGLGIIAALSDAISTWYFEGTIILKQTTPEEPHTPTPPSCCQKITGIGLQLAFSNLDWMKSFALRLVFLTSTAKIFDFQLSSRNETYILLSSLCIAQLYRYTNEAYETNEAIAEKFGMEAPFYAGIFKNINHRVIRKSINWLGSFDHASVDTVIPWFCLIFEYAIDWFRQAPLSEKMPFSLGLTLLFASMSALTLFAAYYFEGRISEINLVKHHYPDIAEAIENERILPGHRAAKKWLCHLINLIAPIHGAGNGIAVFLLAKQWFGKSEYGVIASGLLGLYTLLGNALGTYHSEIETIKAKLKSEMEHDLGEALPLMSGINWSYS